MEDQETVFRLLKKLSDGDHGNSTTKKHSNYQDVDVGVDPEGSALDILEGTSSSSTSDAHDIDVATVMTAVGVNMIIFVLLMMSYQIFSRLLPSVYRSRSKQMTPSSETGHESKRQPMSLPTSFFPHSWVLAVLRVSWSDLRTSGGLDAYMFLRFVRMCFQITVVSGLWGAVILWPIYATGENEAHGWYHLSMANISQGNWRLWIPAVFMWMQTLYVMFVMNEEYKHYKKCRTEFLAKGDVEVHPQQKYSLMVEEIPNELRSDRAMHDYFDNLFPGKVHSACVVLNVPDLEEVSAKRKRVLRRLEKSEARQQVTGRRPTHIVGRPRMRCCGMEQKTVLPAGRRKIELYDDDGRLPQRGERVDSISYYTRYLAILNDKVAKLREEKIAIAQSGDNSLRASQWISHTIGLASDAAATSFVRSPSTRNDELILGFNSSKRDFTYWKCMRKLGFDFVAGGFSSLHRHIDMVVDTVVGATMSSTGFVTFKDLVTVTCAVRARLSSNTAVFRVQMAPEPRDIIWKNAGVHQSWSKGREWTANILLSFGAILWSIPVATLQAFSNLESLSTIPGLGWLSNLQGGQFAAFVNSYLPVVALLTLTMLLPVVFEMIALQYELRKTESDVQKSILSRFFYYQLANVYVTVTAGSIFDSLAEILDHPSNMFALLATSLPSVVGYFIMLVLTKILAGLPMVLLRPGALLRMLLLKMFCREKLLTQQELDEMHKKKTLCYGWEYPTQLLVIVICFTYSVISPFILPVGALYFLGALIVYKNQILTVYSPTYESGGAMFPAACYRTLIGLFCGQVTLIGYSILKLGILQAVLVLPTPLYTYGMMNVFQRMYEEPGEHLSLERAIELDKNSNSTEEFEESGEDIYRQPVLAETDAIPQPYRRVSSCEEMQEEASEGGSSQGSENEEGKIV